MAKSSTQAASDQRLDDRASGGDREALGELYDRHVMPVYQHVYCMVNDREAAEDLTAQTPPRRWARTPPVPGLSTSMAAMWPWGTAPARTWTA